MSNQITNKSMCWIGKNKPQVADKDIEVFKVVFMDNYRKFCSYYYDTCKWVVNESKYSNFRFKFSANDNIIIEDGLHSFSKDCYFTVNVCCQAIDIKFEDEYRLDFYPLASIENLYKMTCIIPRGAVYYLNAYGEYVSDYLIPVKFESLEI